MRKGINLKSEKEIIIMKEGGSKLLKVVQELEKTVRVGMTTLELDTLAEKLIIDYGGSSSFKTVEDYSWTTCLCINEQAVHTPPSNRRILNGDLLKIDIGMLYKGYHTDYTTTIYMGNKTPKHIQNFLNVGKLSLENAIAACKVGNHLGHIAQAFQTTIEGAGYKILKDLTGHGIGKTLHEEPYVLNYVDRPIYSTMKLQKGMTLAVEVIYSFSTEEIVYEKPNGWSIISKDKSLVGEFEKTIAITEKGAILLT